jgi:hypothetical protein
MSELVRCDKAAGSPRRSSIHLHAPAYAKRRTLTPVPARTAPAAHTTGNAEGSVSIVSRAELAACKEWASAFAGHYKDHRYYEMVEDTLHPEFDHRYFVFRDAAGAITSVQPYFMLHQDILTGTGGRLNSLVGLLRRRWPNFLRMRTLMIGCAAGEGHLSGNIDAQRLAGAAMQAAREQRAGLIVLKEFPAKYREALRPLREHSFLKLPSLPMTTLNIDYPSFDDYMTTALSRAARKDLRRKFKATRGTAIEMSVLTDITPIVDELYPLYLQVYERSSLHFEKLTPEYLCELGRRMPEAVRFFVWRKEGRIIAFNICMVHGDAIYDQYIGLDYSVALDLHLYHYTFRDIVTWAIANGCKSYISNGLNYDPKLHLKCQLDPLDLYVRHTSPVVNAVLKAVLPWLEPTRYDKHLKKFANYHELWSHT